MSREEKILVRGLNWLGDAIMGTAALQRLREARPHASITLLSHEKLADLWRHQPFVDDLMTFSSQQSFWATARSLRARHFDLGLAFPNSIRSAMELWLARIPKRVGYARPFRSFLLTQAVAPRAESIPMRKRSDKEIARLVTSQSNTSSPIPNSAHHVHDYLHLVGAVGASETPLPPQIVVTEAEMHETAAQFVLQLGDERPWFGLNPGAEYGPAKRWPADCFVAAALAVQRKTRCRWMIFGGGADQPVAEQICQEIQRASGATIPVCLNLAGRTSLRQLAAALKICRLVITNDTGPMHLAGAVGTPVVVPFGSTSPEMTGPIFYPNARVLKTTAPCSPCFRRVCPIDFRCLLQIEPQTVADAALSIAFK